MDPYKGLGNSGLSDYWALGDPELRAIYIFSKLGYFSALTGVLGLVRDYGWGSASMGGNWGFWFDFLADLLLLSFLPFFLVLFFFFEEFVLSAIIVAAYGSKS